MRLKSITVKNLKGLSFSLELGELNLIVGPNFAGKSARTDAIRLLLLGHLPELGKLPRTTFGLCSGKELVVEGEFDDGSRLSRRWYLKGDVVKTETLGTAEVLDEASGGSLLAVMLNAETYFGLSDRDRVAYVFANIPGLGTDFNSETVVESLHRDLVGVEGLDGKLVDEFVSRIGTPHPEDGSAWTPQTFIEFLLEFARSETSATKSKAVVMEKTAQGLAFLRTQEVVEVDVSALVAELAETKRKAEELWRERARVASELDRARVTKRRREVLTSELAGSAGAVAQRAQVAERVAKLQSAFDALPSISLSELDALRLEDRETALAVGRIRSELESVRTSIDRNELERRELGTKTRCAYCGATGEGWKTTKSTEITSALAGLKTKRGQIEEQLAKVAEHSRAVALRCKQMTDAHGLRAGKERDLRSEQSTLAALDRRLAAVDAKTAELAALPVDDGSLTTTLVRLDGEVATLNAKTSELEARRRSVDGRTHDLQRLAEAEKNRDDARAEELVAKAAEEAIRLLKSQMVADAFVPLLEVANSFFPDVLLTPLAYNDGEIGTWRDGTWVGHQTFSGTEKALAYAAIQSALAARAPVRFMLVDELGRLDDVNAVRFLAGVASAIARGRIEQFVGIDTGRGLLYSGQERVLDTPLNLIPLET